MTEDDTLPRATEQRGRWEEKTGRVCLAKDGTSSVDKDNWNALAPNTAAIVLRNISSTSLINTRKYLFFPADALVAAPLCRCQDVGELSSHLTEEIPRTPR